MSGAQRKRGSKGPDFQARQGISAGDQSIIIEVEGGTYIDDEGQEDEMSLADNVRQYCKETYIDPARDRGDKTVTMRSGDVHSALNYRNRYPLVCSAIGSNLFEEVCNVKRITVEGPLNGVSTLFTFELI